MPRALVLLLLCLLGGLAGADTYSNKDGNITFEIPAGWKVASTEKILDSELVVLGSADQLVAAMVFVLDGTDKLAAATKQVDRMANILYADPKFGKPTPRTINGIAGLFRIGTGTLEGQPVESIGLALGPTSTTRAVAVIGVTQKKTTAAQKKALTAMIESIKPLK